MGKACEPGCTCKRHLNGGKKCPPGCKCGLHSPSKEKLEKMYEGKRRALREGKIHQGKWKDGRSHHPHYSRWDGMMRRCLLPNHPAYYWYGGRGITVYEEWQDNPFSFFRYLDEELGPPPPGHSLDRIDVDGDYRPGNVKWSSALEQRSNQRPQPARFFLAHPTPTTWVIAPAPRRSRKPIAKL